MKIRAAKNSFQAPKKANNPTMTIPGMTTGSITLQSGMIGVQPARLI